MILTKVNQPEPVSKSNSLNQESISTTYQARPTLYVLLGKKKWAEAKKRIESNPEECKVWVTTEYGFEGSERQWWKRLPLHLASGRRPDDVSLMKSLIESFPESMYMKDENGKVPLIHACSSRASLEIVELLLAEGPEASRSPDSHNRLALHWACEYDATIDVVSAVLSSYPDASKHVDAYGRVPLHWECVSLKCSPQTVLKLVKYNPDAVILKDLDGNAPLDLMEHSFSPEKVRVIETLHRCIGIMSA
jgi:hypothetical protein